MHLFSSRCESTYGWWLNEMSILANFKIVVLCKYWFVWFVP